MQLAKLQRGVSAGIMEALSAAAIVFESQAKVVLSEPGRGRLYVKTEPQRRVHRASAPGQPPAVDTGKLRQSVSHRPAGARAVEVGTPLQYGEDLEFGTSKVKPRPWLSVAIVQGRHEAQRASRLVLKSRIERR